MTLTKHTALLIAEKPSLMRTIKTGYEAAKTKGLLSNLDITFTTQAGHLYGLMLPDEVDPITGKKIPWSWDRLPIEPDRTGGFKYAPISSTKDLINTIKSELKSGKYDVVINAGDPDQEGELLIRETLKELNNTLPVLRFWSNDLTEPAIIHGLQNLLDDDKDPLCVNMLEAALARQHSDYVVGMNGTRAASLKMNNLIAIGRVMTPILAIVCQREKEILNFKPKTIYGVKSLYMEGFEGQLFIRPAASKEEKKEEDDDVESEVVYFDTKKEADDFIKNIHGPATVIDCTTKRVKTTAPKLFKLATAQIAAGKLGYSSSETLAIIQELYEMKVLSYPRTDCEYLSSGENYGAILESAKADPILRPYIEKIPSSVIGEFKNNKKYVNDAKLKESGHSALVPTSLSPDFNKLTKRQQDIYHIVAKQFVASFLPPLEQDKTVLLADISGHLFKSNGKTLVNKGYTILFNTSFTDTQIPKHNKGDKLDIRDFCIAEKTSSCPKRFKDADLIAICENPLKYLEDEGLKKLGKSLSIGTPATRAGIIDKLIDHYHYIKKDKGDVLSPSEIGMAIYDNLKDFAVCKVDLTGEWEEKLQLIRAGKYTRTEMEDGMKQFVRELIEQIRSTYMKAIASNKDRLLAKCPKCGGDILSGKNNFFCSNWNQPDKEHGCKFGAYKKIGETSLTDNEYKTLLFGKTIEKKIKSKEGKISSPVLTLNKETGRIEFVQQEKKAIGKCPLCGGVLISGIKGFYCSNWKEAGCKFGTPRIIKLTKISDEEYLNMLDGKEIVVEIQKDKKNSWKQKMKVDNETGNIIFIEENINTPTEWICPKCHDKKLIVSGKWLKCPSEGCFKMWTEIAGHNLAKNEIDSLITGETTQNIGGLKSKTGKKFSAAFKLNKDLSGVEFISLKKSKDIRIS